MRARQDPIFHRGHLMDNFYTTLIMLRNIYFYTILEQYNLTSKVIGVHPFRLHVHRKL